MFTVSKPEYGLVTGDSLTYRCEGHSLIYDDLRMIYKDGLLTYERSRMDKAWHLQGSRQRQQLDLNWNIPIRYFIEATFILCIALSSVRIFEVWLLKSKHHH